MVGPVSRVLRWSGDVGRALPLGGGHVSTMAAIIRRSPLPEVGPMITAGMLWRATAATAATTKSLVPLALLHCHAMPLLLLLLVRQCYHIRVGTASAATHLVVSLGNTQKVFSGSQVSNHKARQELHMRHVTKLVRKMLKVPKVNKALGRKNIALSRDSF